MNERMARLAIVFVLLLTGGCQESPGKSVSRTTDGLQGFELYGSYKNQSGAMLMTVVADLELARRHALDDARARTPPSSPLSAIYYYPPGTPPPSDQVTRSVGFMTASDHVWNRRAERPWSFVYMRGGDGHEQFVQCDRTPTHDLCPASEPSP